MRSAVIDSQTGIILNVIMADPVYDQSPESNSILMAIPEDGRAIDQSWTWTKIDGFVPPPELAAQQTALEDDAMKLE